MKRIGDKVHVGPLTLSVDGHTQLGFEAQAEFAVVQVDEKTGEVLRFLGASQDRQLNLVVREDCAIKVEIEDYMVWSYWAHHVGPDIEIPDPVPVEIIAPEQPDSLEMSLKRLFGQMVMEKYGQDSEELETAEEAMNFDLDGDGLVGGHEVFPVPPKPVVPEEPAPPPADPPADPPPQEGPTTPA
jgi:hypothetical protein